MDHSLTRFIEPQHKTKQCETKTLHFCQWRSQGGGGDFKLVRDSIKPLVWSRRFVAKFV